MSFINFESGREKEKIREELREAREKLLAKVGGQESNSKITHSNDILNILFRLNSTPTSVPNGR